MKPQINSQDSLPKRNTRNVGLFKRCEPRNFVTNFYKVKIAESLNKIYVY